MSYRGGGGGMGGGYKGRGRSSPYSHNSGNRKNWRSSGGKGGSGGAAVVDAPGVEHSPQQLSTSDSMAVHEGVGHVVTEVASDRPSAPDTAAANNSIHRSSGTPRSEKRCSVRSRLFIGNLPRDMKESQVKDMFAVHGEVIEVFVQREKGFGFVRMVSMWCMSRVSKGWLIIIICSIVCVTLH